MRTTADTQTLSAWNQRLGQRHQVVRRVRSSGLCSMTPLAILRHRRLPFPFIRFTRLGLNRICAQLIASRVTRPWRGDLWTTGRSPSPFPVRRGPPEHNRCGWSRPSRTSVNVARRSVLSSGGCAACPRHPRRLSPSRVTTPDLSGDLPATQPSQPAGGSPRPLPITWREVRRVCRHHRSSWLWISKFLRNV